MSDFLYLLITTNLFIDGNWQTVVSGT